MEELLDQAQLRVAADELGLKAVPIDIGRGRQHLDCAPQLKRLGLALERVAPRVLVGDHGRGHLACDVVDEHRSGVGGALNAGRRVDAVANDHALLAVQHGCLAGDDARAGAEVRGSHPASERRHRFDELERSADASRSVILARHRRPPHRHHRIADELVDRPPVPVDDPARGVEVVPEHVAHVGGVPRLRQRGVADEVDEHDGHPP